jgi:hypothetical protein
LVRERDRFGVFDPRLPRGIGKPGLWAELTPRCAQRDAPARTQGDQRMRILALIALVVWPGAGALAETPEPSFGELVRQCRQAQRCAAGDRAACGADAVVCETYVDGVSAPMHAACLAARQRNPTMRMLASEPGGIRERVAAVLRYGDAHPDAATRKRTWAMIALASDRPCVKTPGSRLYDPPTRR